MSELIDIVRAEFIGVQKRAESNLEASAIEFEEIKMPTDINKYTAVIRQVGFVIKDVEALSVKFDYSIIDKLKNDYKKNLMDSWVRRGDDLEHELEKRMAEIEDAVKARVQENNSAVEKEFEKGNAVYLELEQKRQEILRYQEQIINLCSSYGITSNDISIDNNSFPLLEWNEIYDNSISYIKKNAIGVNPISKFKELVDSEAARAVIFILLFILCLTKALNVVAILFFVLIVYSEMTAKDRMEKFAVMLGLIYNVTPLDMGLKTKIDDGSLINEEDEIDNNPETDELIAWYEEESYKYELDNPESTIDKEMDLVTSELTELTLLCKNFLDDYDIKKQDLIARMLEKQENLINEFEDEKKKMKLLGDFRSVHLVYNPKYLLGLKDGVLPEYVETGLRNIVIRPCDDELLMKKFLQCMVINALCNVKLQSISITVCDPNNFGRDLIGVLNDEVDAVFEISTDKMQKVIESFADQARVNLRTLRGSNIQDYNKECEKTGKSAIEYKLIIVLSQSNDKEDKSDEELDSFMKYSAECGIFVWVVSNKTYENTFVFNEPFEGVDNPYDFDEVKFIVEFGDKFGKDLKDAKPEGLPWYGYLEKSFKREDLWTYSANEYVRIEPGFVDGDPARADYYTVGTNGDAHALVVGTSGAGKSVFINQFIGTMTLRYSPKELRLWLVDFKGAEFAMYLRKVKEDYQLPHIDACLCTSDPEYAKSLFKALREVAEDRFANLKELGFRDVVEFNNEMRKQGRDDEIYPQIVMIVDEFQVIYVKGDSNTITQVNNDFTLLSKVARAAAVHLIFCSQSMKGTISNDVLDMFTLRVGLRCSSDVSMQIMGTPYAGNIRQRFGTLYVRSSSDKKAELQKRFKSPFQTKEVVLGHIKDMEEESIKRGMINGRVIEYNEAKKHPVEEVDLAYKAMRPMIEDGTIVSAGTIILGERMTYSKNALPENVVLETDPDSNIFSCFMNMSDLVNFFFTMKRNFDNYLGKSQIIYNAQTSDLHYLCHLDEIITDPALQAMSTRKMSMIDMIALFKNVVDGRTKSGDKSFPIIFVCLGWTSSVGFGIEPNTNKVIDPLNMMMKTACEYNIHWIFIGSAKNSTPNSIVKACEYKICGKVDAKSAQDLVETIQASKSSGNLNDGFAYYNRKGEVSKFKIYQSILTREVKKSEIIM